MSWVLKAKNVILRPISTDDADFSLTLVKPYDVGFFGSVIYPPNEKKEEEWLQEVIDEDLKVVFVIEARDTTDQDSRIGLCGFGDINNRSRKAEIWMILGKEFRNKGYGTDAGRLLVEYGFENLSFNKISARIFETNQASEALARDKLGFAKNTVLEDEFKYAGGFYDGLLYYLTRAQWLEMEDIYEPYKISDDLSPWQ